MTSKELYEHKAEYEEMLSVLKKYEGLPKVFQAIMSLEECLGECENYEHWKINKRSFYSDYCTDLPCQAYLVCQKYIPNQKNGNIYLPMRTEFFELQFTTGPYIFGDDYPQALFTEFYEELKESTKPKYVDDVCHHLYYTEETASNAYEVVQELYQKYCEHYKAEVKKRRIQELQEELANLVKEQNKGE